MLKGFSTSRGCGGWCDSLKVELAESWADGVHAREAELNVESPIRDLFP